MKEQEVYVGLKNQIYKYGNLIDDLVLSARQTNEYCKLSIANSSMAAANIQVALNAIVKLASDIGSIFSIVNAADRNSKMYENAKDLSKQVNDVAYKAELLSQLGMETAMCTFEVSASKVLDMAIALGVNYNKLKSEINNTELNDLQLKIKDVQKEINDLKNELASALEEIAIATDNANKLELDTKNLADYLTNIFTSVDRFSNDVIKKKAINPLIFDELISMVSCTTKDANAVQALMINALESSSITASSILETKKALNLVAEQVNELSSFHLN
ncbi:hypothetical protein EZ428_13710 [Pedobacter frigiditerrae]|uniref:Uncharacterized protein n=1 Tax=Pedobacter frigiditerrae TaxID=2530452 RepID=A0A4R0MTF1_9SPHI|nr:hypothetical protein [Pedobacter frigiditerrae]TCC90328.1 hypothetical protein EZ428_13710 [Pedobacter frigiditerrae]